MQNYEKYQSNEDLLQSYRSIFISSESFLLAVGAIFLEKSLLLLIITSTIGLIMIWCLWFPIVRARHLIVDYYKYQAKTPAIDAPICSVNDYVHNRKLRKETNKTLGIPTNWRETRKKVDLFLPVLFSIVWVSLIAAELWGL